MRTSTLNQLRFSLNICLIVGVSNTPIIEPFPKTYTMLIFICLPEKLLWFNLRGNKCGIRIPLFLSIRWKWMFSVLKMALSELKRAGKVVADRARFSVGYFLLVVWCFTQGDSFYLSQ